MKFPSNLNCDRKIVSEMGSIRTRISLMLLYVYLPNPGPFLAHYSTFTTACIIHLHLDHSNILAITVRYFCTTTYSLKIFCTEFLIKCHIWFNITFLIIHIQVTPYGNNFVIGCHLVEFSMKCLSITSIFLIPYTMSKCSLHFKQTLLYI